MNAGKSSHLLQSSFNYRERGMNTLLFNAKLDTRMTEGAVSSRIGISEDAFLFDSRTDFSKKVNEEIKKKDIHCILIDEAQFLTQRQVNQISDIADFLNIPVLTYGLRTDFQGELFEGSKELLAISDELCELKGMCGCGKKATMVLRTDGTKKIVNFGEQVQIGGNEHYISVCRKHHKLSTRSGVLTES